MQTDHANGSSSYALHYRAEIDGLRAWAVLLVIFFHAKVPLFSGGFVGVDVFFVISGYLITRLIAKEASESRFSLLQFYERRIRRIIPALVVMMAITLIAGAFFVLPPSLERMSQSAMAALLFFSNVHFWQESANYFAPTAETDPFLHTWSLAVEEQFYIFFPVFIALSFRYLRPFLIPACILGFVVTFILSQIGVTIAPTAAFYLSPTRGWEFLAGSLLALNAVPRLYNVVANSLLSALGLTLIAASSFILSPQMGFPGINAVPPVLGAALIIYAAHGALWPPVRLCMTARPILFTGLISYSLYLWHWPLLVFAEHFLLERPLRALELIAVLCLGYGFAVLSYHYVEQPFRRGTVFRPPVRMLAGAGSLTAIAGTLAMIGVLSDGLAARHPGLKDLSMSAQYKREAPAREASIADCFVSEVQGRRSEGCILSQGDPAHGALFLWGDSFALHYTPAMTVAGAQQPRPVISMASPQCPPILNYDPKQLPACSAINQRALNEIRKRNIDTVILAANWFSYLSVGRLSYEDIEHTIETLHGMDLRIAIVGQSPVFHFTDVHEAYYRHARQQDAGDRAFSSNPISRPINERLAHMGDVFIDPTPMFCEETSRCMFHDGKNYLMSDYGHLTLAGAAPVARLILEETSNSRKRNAKQ